VTTILLAGGGTGGHLMPAIAVAQATRELHPEWRCVFVGAERGIEASVLPERHLPHHLLPFHPLYRRQWWKNVRWPFLLPALMRGIDRVLDDESPAAVIGTGGYVSAPVLRRATRRGIPTGILELDVLPGLATRLVARRVREIWVAAPEALDALPRSAREHATLTGAPIEVPDPGRRAAASRRFGIRGGKAVVVVTGGSQGALAVNHAVAEWIRRGGAANVQVIWATGRGTHAQFAALNNPPNVHVIPFIDPMADAWSVADVAVARSGMMTLAELCAWGIPSILVPLPTAAADHQTHNAQAMERSGAARVVPQRALASGRLFDAIAGLLGDPARRTEMAVAARARGRPRAAGVIALRVSALARSP
jgi:UDP-N-acetylglucosamine--N-acetylmuramyl-(pentapeptide) pyrophosphoryl-undecaprenol N-acetylglucosamine transferase